MSVIAGRAYKLIILNKKAFLDFFPPHKIGKEISSH